MMRPLAGAIIAAMAWTMAATGHSAHPAAPAPGSLLFPVGTMHPAALAQGDRGDGCEHFVELSPSDIADIASIFTRVDDDCPTRVLVFAENASPTYLTGAEWQALQNGDVTMTLDPTLPVTVATWYIRSSPTDDISSAHADPAGTAFFFKEWRTGLDLKVIGPIEVPSVAPSDPDDPWNLVAGGCRNAEKLRASSSGYSPDAINVYYVPQLGVSDILGGINCGLQGAPEIIFLKHTLPNLGALAHELGHAFGAWEPNGGHIQDPLNDPKHNVMFFHAPVANGPGGTSPPYINAELSLGQAYRMHYDIRSWVNRDRTVTPPVASCQYEVHDPSKMNWYPCPQLPWTELP